MRTKILFFILLIFIISCSKQIEKQVEQQKTQIANPASVYCKEQGGTLRIEENEKGQYGVCTLPDGTECEEWVYFRGECPKEEAKEEQKEETKSPNLLKWKKEGLRIQNGVSPFVIIKDNEYYMYHPDKDIMLAKSKDGLNFDKGRIVLENKRS